MQKYLQGCPLSNHTNSLLSRPTNQLSIVQFPFYPPYIHFRDHGPNRNLNSFEDLPKRKHQVSFFTLIDLACLYQWIFSLRPFGGWGEELPKKINNNNYGLSKIRLELEDSLRYFFHFLMEFVFL